MFIFQYFFRCIFAPDSLCNRETEEPWAKCQQSDGDQGQWNDCYHHGFLSLQHGNCFLQDLGSFTQIIHITPYPCSQQYTYYGKVKIINFKNPK